MNSGNNSEYYKQKYLKYKFKYLEQKKLIGGLNLGTKKCPEKLDFFDSRKTALKLIQDYKCTYEDLKKLNEQKIEDIQKKDIDNVEIIKKLKSIGFPFDFFYDKFDSKKLLQAGFPLKNFKEKGLTILELYALLKDDEKLLSIAQKLKSLDAGRDGKDKFLLRLFWNQNNIKLTFVTDLIRLISIKVFKDIYDDLKLQKQFGKIVSSPWNIEVSFTKEELDKIDGKQLLEPKDETVRLKYIGTPTDFKQMGFIPAELREEFTLAELREEFTLAELKDEFTVEELKTAFTPAELTAAGFSV